MEQRFEDLEEKLEDVTGYLDKLIEELSDYERY